MAFLRLALFPGAGRQHFEAVALRLQGMPPPSDRLLFAAGAVPDGYQVVQLWRSRAALDTFNRDHYLPAFAAAGRAALLPEAPVVTDLDPDVLLLPDRS